MGNSLADQLLKSGLANKQQAKKAEAEKRRKQKQQRQQKEAMVDENKLAAERARAEKVERDRELNRQKKAAADKKALAAQVKNIIMQNRVDVEEGDNSFNFTDGDHVKTHYLSENQVKTLRAGKLAIARLDGTYELIPTPVAHKIKERASDNVVYLAEQANDDAIDSDYTDFEVPDDLDW